MPSQRNTYRKLDRDTSKNKVDKESFYDCRNFRIMGDDPTESGAQVNVLGNELIYSALPGYSRDTIIGSKQIRDRVILFSTNNTTAAGTPGDGRIWTINFKAASPTPVLIYNGLLNFSTEYPIDFIITRYEDEDVQKVYWADGYNYLRYCNISDSDLLTQDPDDFNIVSDISFESAQFECLVTGRIPVGRVQYSYRLYKKYGGQTAFVPPSRLINLTTSSEGVSNSSEYKGADRLDDSGDALFSGKGVQMKIENVDTDYDKIEIIAIHYSDIIEAPNIYVVTTVPVGSTVYFTDNGVYDQGTYTLAEYTALSNLFVPKTLATKKNILFAANLQEEEFDLIYDARAYRYKTGPIEAKILDDGAYYLHRPGSAPTGHAGAPAINDLSEMPVDWNCFNESNSLTLDPSGNKYKYQTNGSTIGGEGINVSYKFGATNKYIDSSSDTSKFYVSPIGKSEYFTSYASPYNSGYKVGYQRDEIYRFAVILFNGKGQASPGKWIGDIRFPHHYDDLPAGIKNRHAYTSLSITRARQLYIEFTLNNIPDEVVGWQIVRVERKQEDRTILFQGKFSALRLMNSSHTITNGTEIQAGSFVGQSQYNTVANYISETAKSPQLEYIWLNSPELSYYKDYSYSAGDYIQVIGYMNSCAYDRVNLQNSRMDLSGVIRKAANCDHITTKYTDFNSIAYDSTRRKYISDAWLIKPSDTPDLAVNQNTYDSVPFTNLVYAAGSAFSTSSEAYGNVGTGLLLKFDSATNLDLSALPLLSYPILNYRRIATQYGGISFEARTSNKYIPAGEYIVKTENATSMTEDCYGGDCYIQNFDNLFAFFNQAYIEVIGPFATTTFAMVDYLPVETTINLDLVHGTKWNSLAKTGIISEAGLENLYCMIREVGNKTFNWDIAIKRSTASLWEDVTLTYEPGWDDYYVYNTVYSRNDNAKPYFAVEEDYEAIKINDTKVIASMAKYDEEEIDSWTRFELNDTIAVDGNYGPVNYLAVMNDTLLFFQDNAFGTLAVLDRSVVQDTAGKSLALGEGEVLQRYDIISSDRGCSTRKSLLTTPSFLIWFDSKKSRIYRMAKDIENLGVVKGVNSYLQNISSTIVTNDNPLKSSFAGLSMAYNSKFHEVWITFKEGYNNGETLIFNEALDSFTGFIDNPAVLGYISQDDLLISHGLYGNMYQENSDDVDRCLFMGTYYPSSIEVIINPAETLTFTLTGLEFTTEVINNAEENVLAETMTSMQVTNDYQDTTEFALVSGTNIRRLLRTWRINSLRDSAYSARLRDTYAKVKLVHTNQAGSNRKVILHDLVSIFEMPVESIVNKR